KPRDEEEAYRHHPEHLEPLAREDLVRRLVDGDAIVLDVRPTLEYRQGHIAGARSIPVEQLEERLRELDLGREIVAYCRGPYCVFADEAVALLRARGVTARRYVEGYAEWAAAGLPVGKAGAEAAPGRPGGEYAPGTSEASAPRPITQLEEGQMIFRQILHPATGCASYIFGCTGKKALAVVDPHIEHVADYLAVADGAHSPIVAIVETHVQADHLSGATALAPPTGAPIYLHEAAEEVDSPHRTRRDGDEVPLGNDCLRILHTPGHSPDSVCLLVGDRTRGADPWFLLTGDTLFVGDAGRPDLTATAED